ncbi:MAG: diaminopimelate epimerase [Planctomycetaceae bacterium]|nr:diaminopimelate epimerase [Planctomycetaceae bacterium]
MQFTKMHGAGNDYVYVDGFNHPIPRDPAAAARKVSDRHKGIGGDGLILILPSDVADAKMRMFNADGSESEMCGNGVRCVGKYVYDHSICRNRTLRIETGAGVLSLDLDIDASDKVSAVTVDMGAPILEARRIPTTLPGDPVVNQVLEVAGERLQVTCVSMGNPHCVIFVPEITDRLVLEIGPQIERHPAFPQRVNVEFVQVLARNEVRQRTWERGSGETQACGTGASAVCVAGVLTDRTDATIVNHLLGGDLELTWRGAGHHVFMKGPAAEVFQGTWPDAN